MKICFVNQCYWPDHAATAQHLTDLAEELAARGHQVTIVSSANPYTGGPANLKRQECRDGVTICRVRTQGSGKESAIGGRVIDALLFHMGALWRCLRVPKPDVIVTLTSPPLVGIIGWLLASLRNIRHVHWCMDIYPEMIAASGVMKESSLPYRLSASLRSRCLRSCARVVVLSDYMASYIEECGVNDTRIRTIPAWTDGEQVKPIPRESNWFLRNHGLLDKFVVMYSGNLGMGCDLSALVSTFDVLREDADIVFVVISEGPQFEKLRRMSHERGLHNTLYLSYQDRRHLSYSLSAGDVHIVTNKVGLARLRVPSKAFGIMAVGRPIIHVGETRGEIPSLLVKHDIGFVVQDGDVSDLVNRIQELKDDSTLRAVMSVRARAVFEAGYDRLPNISLFEEVLLETLDFEDRAAAGLSSESSRRLVRNTEVDQEALKSS